ncbi:MAG TPA: DUF2782 domain-containing protein [Rudaea sp.]|nr:DUF2782 domain-containing protein [Rudaea sp.]
MKSIAWIVLVFALAGSASAQNRRTDAVPPVQAPPTMEDPAGPAPAVKLPTPEAEAQTAVSDTPHETESKPVETEPLPPEVQAAAEAAELPVITVRQRGADTVEEYRKHGKLYFVRVITTSGPPRFYVDSPQAVPPNIMQQLSGPSGVVQPVYFKLADWK